MSYEIALESGIPVTAQELIAALRQTMVAPDPSRTPIGEVFIALSPEAIAEIREGYTLGHLWPTHVTIDDAGDAIISVTTGDDAQFGGN